jgi:hypothetical protein
MAFSERALLFLSYSYRYADRMENRVTGKHTCGFVRGNAINRQEVLERNCVRFPLNDLVYTVRLGSKSYKLIIIQISDQLLCIISTGRLYIKISSSLTCHIIRMSLTQHPKCTP